jgi:hypothetical protein
LLKIRYLSHWVGICSQIIGEHGGGGVLGASTYDARRGEEWIKAHVTLKRLLRVNYIPNCGGICSQMIDEHGGEGVLGASTYDAGRGKQRVKAHITLK